MALMLHFYESILSSARAQLYANLLSNIKTLPGKCKRVNVNGKPELMSKRKVCSPQKNCSMNKRNVTLSLFVLIKKEEA